MSLFEMLNKEIQRANAKVRNGDHVEMNIFHIGNRHSIPNPQLIQEEDGICVTDGKGNFYNLKHFADIKIRIVSPKNRRCFSLDEY